MGGETLKEELKVNCLKCDYFYLEEDPIVKVCPNCGNTDMEQTIYLAGEE